MNSPTESDGFAIIDARVRLPQDLRSHPEYRAPVRQVEQYDRVMNLSEKMNRGTLPMLLGEMDTCGIGHAIMHAETEGGEDSDVLNDVLSGVIESYPERFSGVGTVDLASSRPGRISRQTAALAERGFLGVTIQPAFFAHDIDARALYPLYSRAEELELIVAIHTGINYSRAHPIRHERPEMLDQVACDFPDLRLIACHAGWPWVAEYCAVARRHPTVHLEFGGIAPKYIAKAATGWDVLFSTMPNILRDQVLYGSDWPVLQPTRALAEWRESGLARDVLTALFAGNAERLFRLNSVP